MAPESSSNFAPAGSSSSSSELSVSVEKDVVDQNGDGHAHGDLDNSEVVDGSVSNGVSYSSGTTGAEVARVNTLPHEIFSSEKSESHSGHLKWGRSKTERPGHNNSQFAQEAAKIFDDKSSEQEKLKLLKRIATVKHDGTVEFEIPGDVEPKVLEVESQSVHNEVEDEPLDATELQYIPPIQIVMLIVGTRGDVQPFIAIGKRLQDFGHRVRLASHANFKEFVLSAGLEFYPLGGDPKVLAGSNFCQFQAGQQHLFSSKFNGAPRLIENNNNNNAAMLYHRNGNYNPYHGYEGDDQDFSKWQRSSAQRCNHNEHFIEECPQMNLQTFVKDHETDNDHQKLDLSLHL